MNVYSKPILNGHVPGFQTAADGIIEIRAILINIVHCFEIILYRVIRQFVISVGYFQA